MVAGLMLLVGIAAFAWFVNIRADFYGTYICARCGAEETVDRRSVAGVAYHEETTIRETAVSEALTASGKRKCQHEWYLTHFGKSSGSFLAWREHADGWTGLVLPMLLDDDEFARELSKMPHAREVWLALVKADASSHRELDHVLGDWFMDGPPRQAFPQWWDRNEKRIRQIGSGSRPERRSS